MIKELAWYMEEGRYTGLVTEFQKVMDDYAAAKSAGSPDAAEKREQVRRLYEEHAVKSGYKPEDSCFINVDTEFFQGDSLNRSALNTFIKEIIRSHCYQQNLWTYMGTTGCMTVISRTEMARNGVEYDKYLPEAYKKAQPRSVPAGSSVQENETAFYLYGDGTVSSTYDRARARLRFDTLQDTSGFDWKRKGYDPNYEVQKDGWHGTFDSDGYWVRVNSREQTGMNGAVTEQHVRALELVKCSDDSAILYDPQFILLSPAEIYYLTDTDSVYGAKETSTEETLERLRETMKSMGVTRITSAAGYGRAAADPKENAEAAGRYRALLGPLAADTFTVTDGSAAEQQKTANRERTEAETGRTAHTELINSIGTLSSAGITGQALYDAVLTGQADVPLSFRNSADRSTAGITDQAYTVLESYPVPEEDEHAFCNAVIQLAMLKKNMPEQTALIEADLPHTAEGTALYEKAYEKIIRRTTPAESVNTEMTFGALCEGKASVFPATPPSAELSAALAAAAERLPAQETPAKQAAADRAVSSVIRHFSAVQQSTGMTPEEAVTEAVRTVHGNTGKPFAPPAVGFVQNVQKPADKRIFFEFPLEALITEAELKPCITKQVPVPVLTAAVQKTADDLPAELSDYLKTTTFARTGLSPEQLQALAEAKLPEAAAERTRPQDTGTAAVAPVYRQQDTAPAAETGTVQTGKLHSLHKAVFFTEAEDGPAHRMSVQGRSAETAGAPGIPQQSGTSGGLPETPAVFTGTKEPGELLYSTEYDGEGIPLAVLTGLTADKLAAEHGWTNAEAQTAMYTLRSLRIPADKADRWQNTAAQIAHLPSELKTAEAFRRKIETLTQTADKQTVPPGAAETFPTEERSTADTAALTLPASGTPPALLHSAEGFTGDSSAVPLVQLAGITPAMLVHDYGYEPKEAEAAARIFGTYALPAADAERYASLAPGISSVLGSCRTVKTLRRNMRKFARSLQPADSARPETFTLLHSTAGFDDTAAAVPLVQLAGITPDMLVHDYGYEPKEAEAAARTLSNYALPRQQAEQYATAVPEIMNLLSRCRTAGSLRRNLRQYTGTYIPPAQTNIPSALTNSPSAAGTTPYAPAALFSHLYRTPYTADVPVSFTDSPLSADTATALPASPGRTDTPASQSPLPGAVINGSAFTNADVPATMHAARTSPHLYNNVPVDPPAPADGEAERMRRINEHYEHDRAELARKESPALARSDTHDIGHAEGTGKDPDTASIRKNTRYMEQLISEKLKEHT